MTLQYQNITIRNAGVSDANQLVVWWNDGAVMTHAGFPLGLGTTPEKVASELATDCDSQRRRLILLLEDLPIGEMCYRILEDGNADIGIKICESAHQEKGIGRKALSMLIRALFDMGCPKIVLDTSLKNLRAQHVYETLGFQKLRVNIDSWKNQLGEPESSVDYALTEDDFIDFTKESN